MKQNQPHVHPRHRYYIVTDKYKDLFKLSKMPGGNNLAKALQVEADAFHNLEIKRDLAKALLEDQGRLTSSTPANYLTKLETAVTEYKTAVSAVIAASEEAEDKTTYKEKLTAQIH